MWINAAGKRVWVKYHFKTDQGIQSFTAAEAKAMKAEDPDYHRRDLHQAIERKDYPAWLLEMQIMPFEDAATYRFNPFDLTKVWPHRDHPPITVGRLVLDRNPENFFAQIEQAAFSPANMVSGIGPARTGCCSGVCSATRKDSEHRANRVRTGDLCLGTARSTIGLELRHRRLSCGQDRRRPAELSSKRSRTAFT